MNQLAKWFILSGIFYALAGMLVGLYMAAHQDFQQRPLHAHLNLMGWVSMAIFGLYYAVVGSNQKGKLPKIQFALANLGMLFVIPGLALVYSGHSDAEIYAKLGAILFFASMLVFGWVVLRSQSTTE